MAEKTIVEINGDKFEVDAATTVRIEKFKVGTCVKVYHKSSYGSPEVRNGIIIGFLAFKDLPTIQIAELLLGYNEARLEFVNFNSATENIEIVNCPPHEMELEKPRIIDLMNREIHRKELELEDLKHKKDWFCKLYGKYFENKDEDLA